MLVPRWIQSTTEFDSWPERTAKKRRQNSAFYSLAIKLQKGEREREAFIQNSCFLTPHVMTTLTMDAYLDAARVEAKPLTTAFPFTGMRIGKLSRIMSFCREIDLCKPAIKLHLGSFALFHF